MARERVSRENKRISANYSIQRKFIDEIHIRAEKKKQTDSFYLNALIEKALKNGS